MPNLFKRKQVWFQVLVYSRCCHKRSKPHSPKMAWHSPEFKDSTLAGNFETLSPDMRLWELGAHFGERHISLANSPLSAVRNIHKTKSATCFHCCRAHHRYSQTAEPFHSLLGPLFTSSIRHLVVSLPRRTVPLFIFFVCYFWLQWQHN